MTQIEIARKGKYSKEMLKVAKDEGVSKEYIRKNIAEGKIIITSNIKHRPKKVVGIGKGLSTKVNVNIGTSSVRPNLALELKKLAVALKHGADAVMDLSTGGDLDKNRKLVIKGSDIAVGTVPLYQAMVKVVSRGGSLPDITGDDMMEAVIAHIKDGVDFVTVHCGVTRETIERMKQEGRIAGIVSRGGSFIAEWMHLTGKQNPLYERYDELLEIAKAYDCTLSLGDGLRPGCGADATDRAQVHELITLGELADRAVKAGVQVMIEGPGHVPLKQVEANMLLQKRLCHEVPFYVLGPLVTDIAPGYDHITSAIGGAIAGAAGADFLCYVTPSEHLRLPDVEDVRMGTIASKIAAHVADIAKGVPGAAERDRKMSVARKALDWEGQEKYALDPYIIRKLRKGGKILDGACSMCGKYCAMKRKP